MWSASPWMKLGPIQSDRSWPNSSIRSPGAAAGSPNPLRILLRGDWKIFEAKVTTMRDPQGRVSGRVMVLEELTELVKAQQMAAWSDAARRIAHEIKNPLTPIRLSAERLLEETPAARCRPGRSSGGGCRDHHPRGRDHEEHGRRVLPFRQNASTQTDRDRAGPSHRRDPQPLSRTSSQASRSAATSTREPRVPGWMQSRSSGC